MRRTKGDIYSEYLGVHWAYNCNKWVAMAIYKGERHYFGYYSDELEAAKERDRCLIELAGEDVRLNFPPPEPEITIPNTRWIRLTKGKWALVDAKNYEWLNQWNWYAQFRGGNWYAVRMDSSSGKMIAMHRLILGVDDKGIFVDHINHNGIDNRECNIRKCTPGQNNKNQKVSGKGTSKFKGVRKKGNHYEAKIKVDRVDIYLGCSMNELQMANRYNMAAMWFHEEWCCINKNI